MRLLSARDIAQALPMHAWMDALEPAFIAISDQSVNVMARQSLAIGHNTGLLVGAAREDKGLIGKLVSVVPDNPGRGLPGTTGAVLLCDPETGVPRAWLDGASFTAWRTGAVAGLGTRVLAREDACRAVLVGCGAQASPSTGRSRATMMRMPQPSAPHRRLP